MSLFLTVFFFLFFIFYFFYCFTLTTVVIVRFFACFIYVVNTKKKKISFQNLTTHTKIIDLWQVPKTFASFVLRLNLIFLTLFSQFLCSKLQFAHLLLLSLSLSIYLSLFSPQATIETVFLLEFFFLFFYHVFCYISLHRFFVFHSLTLTHTQKLNTCVTVHLLSF